MNKGLRRVAAVAVAALVVAPALATAASATPTFAFDRLAGSDRNATAVAVAAEYGNSTNVILANGTKGHTVDALTAAYLAGVKKAPVLLTALNVTPDNVLARITASGATDIWLVGDEGVISASQAAALDAKFGTVHRLGGLDRFLTAQAIIAEASKTAASKTAIVTTGFNFPDALGAGPLAYVKNMPIGITSRGTLPAATLTALKDAKVTSAIVLGGPTIVTPAIVAELTAAGITPFVGAGVEAGRIYGANRSETSAKLAEYELLNGFSNTGVNVASGQASLDGADALGGAALSGKETRPTLITESVTNPGGVIGYLTARCATLDKGHIFGDKGAVSATSEAAMQAAGRCTASNQTYSVTAGDTVVTPVTGSRTYTASGMAAGTKVRIALVTPSNVDGGVFTFDAANREAALTYAGGTSGITSVNGVGVGPVTVYNYTTVGTSFTFTVKGTVAEAGVVPVVFNNTDADDALELNLAGVATEPVGIGGMVTFKTAAAVVPAENADFTATGTEVNSINGSTSFTVLSGASTSGSLNMLATDTYKFGTVTIDKAKFLAVLSSGGAAVGDVISLVYVNGATATSPSTFTITTDKFPSNTDATNALTTPTADGNVVTEKYTNPVTTSVGGTTFDLQRAPVVITGSTETVGTYASVKTGLVADYNQTTFTQTVADGNYKYRMVYTAAPFSGTATATGTGTATLVVPPTASTAIPALMRTYTTINTSDVGHLNKGDQVQFVFDRAITTPVVGAKVEFNTGGSIYTYTAADSTDPGSATFSVNTSAVTIDGASIGAGRVLTLTVLVNTSTLAPLPTHVSGFVGVGNTFGVATFTADTGLVDA